MRNLDMDALRTLAAGTRLESFARASQQLGRSQSAISAQLRKLELQAGRRLVRKNGRGLALTEAGQLLLHYAERILAMNDAALAALHGLELGGQVRLGLLQDLADTLLAPALGRFAADHPGVRVEARVERSATLLDLVRRGELDLALLFEPGPGPAVATVPATWIAAPDFRVPDGEELPLVMLDSPCLFRRAALAALDEAGVRWRIALSSASLSTVWAAVRAGLGVTARTVLGLPTGAVPLAPEILPSLPPVRLCLHMADSDPAPAAARLRESLLAALPSLPRLGPNPIGSTA